MPAISNCKQTYAVAHANIGKQQLYEGLQAFTQTLQTNGPTDVRQLDISAALSRWLRQV